MPDELTEEELAAETDRELHRDLRPDSALPDYILDHFRRRAEEIGLPIDFVQR